VILQSPQLLNSCIHPDGGEKLALRGPCFIAAFLRIQIEGRSDLAVTQESLHGLGFGFRFVHQPAA